MPTDWVIIPTPPNVAEALEAFAAFDLQHQVCWWCIDQPKEEDE